MIVPGSDDVHLQLLKGAPAVIMRAYAADYNMYIERLRDADSAGWTPTNAVATSNHLNGTAMDMNWNTHPFQVSFAGYTPPMTDTMREILDFYEGIMFWAQDWDSPKDCMHHQMGYDTWNNPHTGDFIKRKIRVDGYSTFRRGDLPAPPPGLTQADQYAAVIINEGRKRGISERGQKIAISAALVESNLKNYANSNVPESLNIPHDAVGSDHDSVGLFQQRCPMWGPAEVLMDPAASANLFYDHLVQLDYDNPDNSPGYYAQQVQRSAYRGRYDERYDDACEIYDLVSGVAPALPVPVPVPAPPGGGFMPALSDDEQRELLDRTRQLWGALFNPVPTKGRYGNDAWATKDLIVNDDGFLFNLITEHDAALGDPVALERVQNAANAGDNVAQGFLNQLAAPAASPPPAPPPTAAPAPQPQTAPPQPTPKFDFHLVAPPPPQQPPAAPPPGLSATPPASFHETVDTFAADMAALKAAMQKLIG